MLFLSVSQGGPLLTVPEEWVRQTPQGSGGKSVMWIVIIPGFNQEKALDVPVGSESAVVTCHPVCPVTNLVWKI